MRFLHLSDLHLGKRVNGFSLLEEQADILQKILVIIDTEKPQAIFIAGDIYDVAVPPVEAIKLFDWFLMALWEREKEVFVISGNHDSGGRLSFANGVLSREGIYFQTICTREFRPITLTDEYGPINIYLLPFCKPVQVKQLFPEVEIHSYDEAVAFLVQKMSLQERERNILLAHQFIVGASTSDSEELNIGGLDGISVEHFLDFDYVALGHLHRPQKLAQLEYIRYSGTPLKYSFSECGQDKVVVIGELGQKGDLKLKLIPLIPKRDMRVLRGSFQELIKVENYRGTAVDDYLSIILTDEVEIPECLGKLRQIYPNIMQLSYEKILQRETLLRPLQKGQRKNPLSFVKEFYKLQNGLEVSAEQRSFLAELIDEIWQDKE